MPFLAESAEGRVPCAHAPEQLEHRRSTVSDRPTPTLNELAAVAAGWLRDTTGRLIEAVDPAPGADDPRVPLDTLLNDAGKGGVATGSDRSAGAGPERP
jgi:hypothetical protein